MRSFDYYAPATVEEAVDVLATKGPGGRILAGGTDLLPLIKERGYRPPYLVSLRRLAGLRDVGTEDGSGLRIGAATLCRTIETSPLFQDTPYQIAADGAKLVGSIQVRNLATIGGNICNAAPSADGVPGLIALGARATLVGPQGRRTVALEDVFVGPRRTILGPAEMLLDLFVPKPAARTAGAYLRHVPRMEMDIAVAGVGSLVTLDEDGETCRDARIVMSAVAPTPLRAKKAEAVLIGRRLTEDAFREAGQAASLEAQPISDVRGSADYRRKLVRVLTQRTLAAAVARAQQF